MYHLSSQKDNFISRIVDMFDRKLLQFKATPSKSLVNNSVENYNIVKFFQSVCLFGVC